MAYSFTSRGRASTPSVPAIPIVPVLEFYGFDPRELKDYPHGWFKIRCAFHGETQASASYSTDLNAFNCHACSMSGDSIKIIRLMEPSLSFKEAVAKGCEIAGVGEYEAKAKEREFKVKRVSGVTVARDALSGGSRKSLRLRRRVTL